MILLFETIQEIKDLGIGNVQVREIKRTHCVQHSTRVLKSLFEFDKF